MDFFFQLVGMVMTPVLFVVGVCWFVCRSDLRRAERARRGSRSL